MTVDIGSRALEPLSGFIGIDEFPLVEFLPVDTADEIFDALHLVDPVVTTHGSSVVFDGGIAWEGTIGLQLPGTDLVSVTLGAAGAGWTALWCRMVVGSTFEFLIVDAPVTIQISDALLTDSDTGGPVDIVLTTSMRFSPDGVELLDPITVDIAPAAIADTGLIIEATGASFVSGTNARPGFVAPVGDDEADTDIEATFEGVVMEAATLTLPADWFANDDGSAITVTIAEAAVGTTGFTGAVTLARGDAEAPDTGTFGGFPARFQSASVVFVENAIEQAALEVDFRLPVLEEGSERWVRASASFTTTGDLTASLAAVQPDGGSDPNHLISFEIADVVTVGIDALRLEHTEGRWTAWIAGAIAVLIEAAEGEAWPELSFTEIGIGDDMSIHLDDDAGITLDAPLVVDFDLAKLSLETMRLGRGSTDGSLVVGANGGIELLKGLPVGVSVKGLEIEFTPGTGDVSVSLDGIGMSLSVPGSFSAALEVGYVSSDTVKEFRGAGNLAIPALDIDVEVAMLVGRDLVDHFNYFQVFADARLMPTGIPIANTGIAIYGLQGLVAHNRTPDWDETLPADERYYALFSAPPVGVTDLDKWRNEEGQQALGLGVVIGTIDRGFLFSTKGLFVVTFPDVTLMLQSRTDLVAVAPELADATEGSIESLLVYAAAERALSFSLDIGFEVPAILSIGGHAGAFFDFDDPGAWYVELGRDEPGERMTANVFGWEGTWLFTAGAWFRIDARGLDTGVRLDVDLTAEKAGFWIGAMGYASAGMYFNWSPPQWEGSAGYGLTVGAGYKKVAISFHFDGNITVTVPAPTGFDLTLEACISLLITDICKSFRFQWELPTVPDVSSPEGPRFAAPRHYTVHSDPLGPDENGDERLIDGVVALTESASGQGPEVELNSAITIEFERAMIDGVGFNEGIALADGGYRTIGDRSNWSVASELVDVSLIRDPDGDAEHVDLWGTWALDTLEQNTRLRLFSSERFDHDGSLTTSFVTDYTIDYCAEPTVTRTCLSLRGLQPGFQWLDDGSIAGWVTGLDPDIEIDTTDGVMMSGGGVLTLYLATAPEDVTIRLYRPWTDEYSEIPGRVDSGTLVLTDSISGDLFVAEICWNTGHSGHQWSTTTRSGTIVTDRESWSIPADEQLLRPNSTYELRVTTRTMRKSPTGNVETPLGDITTTNRFHTNGPPDFDGALTALVTDTVPAAGDRAVYLGYDLSVALVEEYVASMWTSVGAELRLRLVDSSGHPVVDIEGNEALATITTVGAIEHSITTQFWDQLVEAYRDGPCLPISPPPLPPVAEVVEYIGGTDLAGLLEPNTRYEAQIVSREAPTSPLFAWTFTTGRYETFGDLVATDREVAPAHQAPAAVGKPTDFDSALRTLGLATIAYVDRFTVTAVLDSTGTSVQSWLFEAPEPLEPGTRLAVQVAGSATTLLANGDGTRVLVIPPTAAPIADTSFGLTWNREAPGLPRRLVDGFGGSEITVFTVDADTIRSGDG